MYRAHSSSNPSGIFLGPLGTAWSKIERLADVWISRRGNDLKEVLASWNGRALLAARQEFRLQIQIVPHLRPFFPSVHPPLPLPAIHPPLSAPKRSQRKQVASTIINVLAKKEQDSPG